MKADEWKEIIKVIIYGSSITVYRHRDYHTKRYYVHTSEYNGTWEVHPEDIQAWINRLDYNLELVKQIPALTERELILSYQNSTKNEEE